MALRVLEFAVTIPAGTAKSALEVTPLDLDNWEVEVLDLEVPPGPSGVMGFYVANNGVQWVPFTKGAFLVWDDVRASWPLQGQPNASGWQLVGYNEGQYDHTVTVRFHVGQPKTAAAIPTVPSFTFVGSGIAEPEPILL